MAFLHRRRDGRVEIRESRSTRDGPRARTLVVFRGPLTPDVLERAAARARRPLDREALAARAAELGVATTRRRADTAARTLLAELRRGDAPDPVLTALLRDALARAPAAPAPEPLAEVAGWIGVDERRRGHALRGLLRTADRLVRARPRRRRRSQPAFPRFTSRRAGRRAGAAS